MELGKTSVPLQSHKRPTEAYHSDYFIWRTQMDTKVRTAHLEREGLVFHKDDLPDYPGTAYNCRCFAEPVPKSIIIKDHINERKAFDIYLRTGVIVKERSADFMCNLNYR